MWRVPLTRFVRSTYHALHASRSGGSTIREGRKLPVFPFWGASLCFPYSLLGVLGVPLPLPLSLPLSLLPP